MEQVRPLQCCVHGDYGSPAVPHQYQLALSVALAKVVGQFNGVVNVALDGERVSNLVP
ncbi:hypothetical protein D3C85_1777020 [compost metagenome]